MQQEIELFLQGFETEAVAALAGNRCHLTGKLPARFASRLLSMPISASDPLAHGAIHIFISMDKSTVLVPAGMPTRWQKGTISCMPQDKMKVGRRAPPAPPPPPPSTQ